jgi:hypothetical protein
MHPIRQLCQEGSIPLWEGNVTGLLVVVHDTPLCVEHKAIRTNRAGRAVTQASRAIPTSGAMPSLPGVLDHRATVLTL